jgi:hypothetical protein
MATMTMPQRGHFGGSGTRMASAHATTSTARQAMHCNLIPSGFGQTSGLFIVRPSFVHPMAIPSKASESQQIHGKNK